MASHWFFLVLMLGSALSADVPAELRTSAAFHDAIASGKPLLILFTSSRPACTSCARVAPLWAGFVQQSRGRGDVVSQRVDCARLPGLCAAHGVTRYPRIEFFLGGMDERFIYYGSRRPEKLKQLLTSRTQVPNALLISHGMSRLTTQTHEQHLAHGTHLVMFHAHWCSHCRSMMPAYESLARMLATDPTVGIARVECEEDRAVCQAYAVKGYPTILLIVDGDVKSNYDGARDATSMLSFLHRSTGRSAMPGSFAVSSVETQRLAAESASRHRKYGSGVALPLPTSPPPATAAGGGGGDEAALAERFAVELLRWTKANRDAQGRVQSDALVAKIKTLLGTLRKPGRGETSSETLRGGGGGMGKADKIAAKLQNVLKERGLDAKVQTIVIDQHGNKLRGDVAAGTDADGVEERTGAAAALARGQTDGTSNEELSDQSVAELQQQLETELNSKLRKHLASGEINEDQLAAVKNFVGQLQGGGAAGNAGPDNQPVEFDVDIADNQFLSADDVRSIREAVVQQVEEAQARGELGGVEPGPGAPVEGEPAGRYTQAGVLKLAEEKIRQQLSQRLRGGRQTSTGATFRKTSEDEMQDAADAGDEQDDGAEHAASDTGEDSGANMAEEDADRQEEVVAAADRMMAAGTLDLNPVVFDKAVARTPVFVMFHAPWCKHCHTFEPVWRKLGERLRGVRGVLIAKFNCEKFQEFCRQKEIPSFPELVLFKSPDHQVHYSGSRDVDSLHRYVLNHVPNLQAAGPSDGLHVSESSSGGASPGGLRAPDLAVSNLWHIAEDEFTEATATPLALILYTFPYCQHTLCKQSRANFEQLANEIVEPDVSLAQVDCIRSAQMCDARMVQRSPMGWYGVFKDGKLEEAIPVSSAFSEIDQLRDFVNNLRSDISGRGDDANDNDNLDSDDQSIPDSDEQDVPDSDETSVPDTDPDAAARAP